MEIDDMAILDDGDGSLAQDSAPRAALPRDGVPCTDRSVAHIRESERNEFTCIYFAASHSVERHPRTESHSRRVARRHDRRRLVVSRALPIHFVGEMLDRVDVSAE